MYLKVLRITLQVSLVLLVACGPRPTTNQGSTTSIPQASITPQEIDPTPVITITPAQKTEKKDPETPGNGCPATISSQESGSTPVVLGPGNGIPESEAKGDELVLTGTLYARDCTPLPGVSLDVWQTDANGEYGPGHGTEQMRCCYYVGTIMTDSAGAFEMFTVKPGHYKGEGYPPPAHIHVMARFPGMSSGGQYPGTEIVFTDDPYLPKNAEKLDYTIVHLTRYQSKQGDVWKGIADIVLPIDPPVQPAVKTRSFSVVSGKSEVAYHITEQFADLATISKASGVTTQVEGLITIDFNGRPIEPAVSFTADLRDLRSDDPNRDEKLADRWLVTNQHPVASFISTNVINFPEDYREGEEARFSLEGDLTIRGVTRPVTFQASARLEGDVMTADASTQILMSDFGIEPPSLLGFVQVEDEVVITVKISAQEKINS